MATEKWWKSEKDDGVMTTPERVGCPTRFDRFYLKKGEKRLILFVEDNPDFCVFEHQVKTARDWRNWCTCLQMLGKPCPVCAKGNLRYAAAPFPIIDTTEYVDGKGESHANTRRLLVAKQNVWEKLKTQIEWLQGKGLGLKGAAFTVSRGTGEQSPNCGDTFLYEGHVDFADLGYEPYDLPEIFAPDEMLATQLAEAYVPEDRDSKSRGGGGGRLAPGAGGVRYRS